MSPWIITWVSVGLGLLVQQETGDPGAGAAYAEKVCAQCHTITGARPSPEATAPPFEVVANTPGMTATALAVWLTTSHPTMPISFLSSKIWILSSRSFLLSKRSRHCFEVVVNRVVNET
jgi:hypothetical protein